MVVRGCKQKVDPGIFTDRIHVVLHQLLTDALLDRHEY